MNYDAYDLQWLNTSFLTEVLTKWLQDSSIKQYKINLLQKWRWHISHNSPSFSDNSSFLCTTANQAKKNYS